MQTVAPWMATNNLMGRDRFGISLDDPSVTKPAMPLRRLRGESRRRTSERQRATQSDSGGRYAALAFEGTGEE